MNYELSDTVYYTNENECFWCVNVLYNHDNVKYIFLGPYKLAIRNKTVGTLDFPSHLCSTVYP